MRFDIKARVAALALVALTLSGCVSQRFITTLDWRDADTMYFAYTEKTGASTAAKVHMCARRDDNSLQCKAQDDLNRVLNNGQ